ncbi:MAG: hypothetical protein MUF39_08055 [Cyclobacteriaceae bacterium]|jgi:hypothetical protein|nr:hypothetical protein [Cyclobacteriaceae bacterium]
MKTILFILVGLSLSVSSLAAVRTVSNNPTRPAQFTNFAAAQTASVNGDTIYIYGSPFPYPDITVGKRLVIIGAGYNPNNQFGQATTIANIILFRDTGVNNASGTVITGVLTGRLDISGIMSNNIRVFRCRFTSYINMRGGSPTGYADGWIFYNNIFQAYLYGGGFSRTEQSATNIVIANNIFTGNAYLYDFNSNTIIVDHNIFLGANNLYRTFNIIVTNNIFTRTTGTVFYGATSGPVLCTFNNNLSYLTTIADPSTYTPATSFVNTFTGTGGGSNFGGGNIVGQDPLYVSVSNFNDYVATANYRLQASSLGKNAGTDGTDLGIYGGSYPFPVGGPVGSGYDTSPMPPIPQVTELNIQNATVPVNGTLNVNVKANINN